MAVEAPGTVTRQSHGEGAAASVKTVASRGRWVRATALALACVLAGVGLGWAGRTLLLPPPPLPQGQQYTTVTVQRSTVQRSLNLSASAKWSGGPQVVNSASGVITEHKRSSGERIKAGNILYTVDLQPVVVIEGTIPVFRDLVPGYEGKDVRQLQAFLQAAGQRSDQPTGRFDNATLREVKSWQRDSGLPVTGTVPMRLLVVVPTLPGVLSWGSGGAVGARVGPSAVVAQIVPPQPSFSMVLPENQRGLARPGMAVTIRRAEITWDARLGTIGEAGPDGSATATLLPVQGQKSICGDECSRIPLAGDGSLPSSLVVVPAQSGPVIPTAALAVGTDGGTVVVAEDGRTLPVRVVASASGLALVSGVEVGQRVRVHGGPSR